PPRYYTTTLLHKHATLLYDHTTLIHDHAIRYYTVSTRPRNDHASTQLRHYPTTPHHQCHRPTRLFPATPTPILNPSSTSTNTSSSTPNNPPYLPSQQSHQPHPPPPPPPP